MVHLKTKSIPDGLLGAGGSAQVQSPWHDLSSSSFQRARKGIATAMSDLASIRVLS